MRVVKLKSLKTVFWWIFFIIIILVITKISTKIKTGETNVNQLKFEIEEWKQQYKALEKTFQAACTERKYLISLENKSQAPVINNRPPTIQYEKLKRRIYTNIKELWYYINDAIKSFSTENKAEFSETDQKILEIVAHRKMSLLADMESLSEVDGWHEWRKKQAVEVSSLVQRRLHYFQTHLNCSEGRICLCNTFRNCGFGCQIHQMAFCLIHGYATVKPVALTVGATFANYSLMSMLQPVSKYCTNYVNFTDVADYDTSYRYLPLVVPEDLATRVMGFNGDPASWWIGQIVKFVLKPLPDIQAEINNTITKLSFKTPIVGVHIRRTDKIIEAAYHNVEEYMSHVKDYYDKLEMKKPVDERRVYLATDDISVVNEARSKFPKYKFLYEREIVEAAADFQSRWSKKGMRGFLVDVHLLAMCDFFVGTFSSQLGRLVYEMMQANRVDASESFVSLDDIFFFPIMQRPHDRIAMISHAGDNNTISFEVGDYIGVAGNHWNGYGKGINKRTNESGLFPWYKTYDHLVMYPFPSNRDMCDNDNQ